MTKFFSAYAQLDVNAYHAAFLLFSGSAPVHFDLTFSLMAPSFKGSCLKTPRETQYSGATRFLQDSSCSRGR